MRVAAHQEALGRMQASAKYEALTEREWSFVQLCLAYSPQHRPTAAALYRGQYISSRPS